MNIYDAARTKWGDELERLAKRIEEDKPWAK
jgi:hypothetical protein